MLIKFLSYLSFVVIWFLLVGIGNNSFSLFLALIIPSLIFLYSVKLDLIPKNSYFKLSAIFYFIWLLKEIILSAVAVSKIAWRKNLRIQPILEPVKTIQDQRVGAVIYANSITLTPGTVTISMIKNNLYVHALDHVFLDDLKEGIMDSKVKKIIK